MTPLCLPAVVFLDTKNFFGNCLRKFVPPMIALIMVKFEQIWKQSFKGRQNRELTCYRHNWLIFKENMSFGIAVSSHSGFMPFETEH